MNQSAAVNKPEFSDAEFYKSLFNDDFRLEEWQYEPLNLLTSFMLDNERSGNLFFNITGAHGTGKTTFTAICIVIILLIHADNDKPFKGSLFSGKFDQLKTTLLREVQLWASQSKYANALDLRSYRFGIKNNKYAIDAKSWSLIDPHKVAGQHEDTSIIIMDEASAIPNIIIDKLQGSTSDRRVLWIMTSNSDKNFGFVYDVFHNNIHPWRTYKISHTQLTFLRNRDFEERLKSTYGEESDEYRVKVLGEFPRFSSAAFIDRGYIGAAQLREPLYIQSSSLKMGVDVASGMGADDSTIVIRRGAKIVFAWRERVSLEELKAQIMNITKRFNLTTFAIDEVGIGMGLLQSMAIFFPGIIGVNGASKPNNINRFYNRRAELYSDLRDWVMQYGAIPQDALFSTLVEELATLEHEYRGSRLLLKSKKELEKSPDFADALAYTFAVPDTDSRQHFAPITQGERSIRNVIY